MAADWAEQTGDGQQKAPSWDYALLVIGSIASLLFFCLGASGGGGSAGAELSFGEVVAAAFASTTFIFLVSFWLQHTGVGGAAQPSAPPAAGRPSRGPFLRALQPAKGTGSG